MALHRAKSGGRKQVSENGVPSGYPLTMCMEGSGYSNQRGWPHMHVTLEVGSCWMRCIVRVGSEEMKRRKQLTAQVVVSAVLFNELLYEMPVQ